MINAPTYQYGQPPTGSKKRKALIAVAILLTVALVAVVVWWFFLRSDPPAEQAVQPVKEAPVEQEEAEPQPAPLPNIQPVVDDFVANNSGTYSILITSTEGVVLASHNPDQSYFAASIYKLYVAYEGYKQVDEDKFKLNESYLNGKTRGQCLDAMIRDSDSPCGEKMWAELGKQALDNQMKDYGLTKTSMVNLSTTASDAAIILRKIQTGEGLSEESRTAYLDSMKTQDARYRRGLPSGFEQATVYNKVGWNLDKEWHDTAIVTLPDGRSAIVAVFTTNAGFRNIAKLGSTIENALLQ